MSYYEDDFIDYQGQKIFVNWTKRLWKEHLTKHPELFNFKSTSGLISDAVLKPSLVMAGTSLAVKGEFLYCYYKEIGRHQQVITFIKCVVGRQKDDYYVKSVMRKNASNYLVVREREYNNFKEIWKSPNSYL